MQPHKHSHLYRQRDVHTVISRFGNKPSQQVRHDLKASLEQHRQEFVEKQTGQQRNQTRGRGDGELGR